MTVTRTDAAGTGRRTVGVEEELLLFEGLRPAPLAQQVAADASGDVEHELKLEQAEIATAPRETLAEVHRDLRERRCALAAAAGHQGARPAGLATCPVPVRPTHTPNERYARLVEQFGLVAREQLCCGAHVHVAVASRAEGVRVLDAIRPWLAVLVAVAANSPYWQGRDAGYASYRTVVWSRFPTAGATEAFGDEAAYDAVLDGLVHAGAALDIASIYFDARLSATFPTVEIRVADVGQRAADDVLLAGLCRALVDAAAAGEVPALPVPAPRTEVLRAASWRAARFGVTDDLVDFSAGRLRPAADVVAALLDALTPALRRYGDEELVRTGIEDVLHDGTGAQRQRRSGDPRAAVADAVARFLD